MLDLKQIKLKPNLLLVEEHPVEVEETSNGVMLNPERIKAIKESRRFRTGTVILEGENTFSSIFIKGKSITSLLHQIIIYPADAVDVIDIPVEGTTRLISINSDYIFGIITDESTLEEFEL